MPAATTSGWLDEKVADAALTTKRLVHITLGDVTLKLTLTSKFLGRPFLDAVVKPFVGARPRCLAAQRLGIPTVPPRTPVASNNPTIFRAGAYNKKSGEAVKLEDVLSAIIDGVPCHELSTSAAALLPLADWTRVELQLSGSGPATTPTLARVPVPDSSRDWREAALATFALSGEDSAGWALAQPAHRLESSVTNRAAGHFSPLLEAAAAEVSEASFELKTGDDVSSRAVAWYPSAAEGADGSSPWRSAAHPTEGLPLVILIPSANEHARSASTLWHAWRLVLEQRCVVVALDALPHHGARAPDGSDDAHRHPEWPRPFLDDLHEPWSGAKFRGTLSRAATEVRYAVDLLLAASSPLEPAVARDGMESSLRALADARRGGLAPPRGPRLVNERRVGIMAYGIGAVVALDALAAEERAQARIVAAVFGGVSDVFQQVGPGSAPAPPAEHFSARVLKNAERVRTPLLMVANEEDELAPLARAQALFKRFPILKNKRLKIRAGGHLEMTAAELAEQDAWLLGAMDPSVEHHFTGYADCPGH